MTDISKVNKWLKKHKFDITARCGDEFQYLINKEEESIVIADTDPYDDDLVKVCKRFGLDLDDTNLRVFCFLHELGHFLTIEDYTFTSLFIHNIIMKLIPDIQLFDKLAEYIHHRTDFELGATQWACEYMLKHPREVKKLQCII